MKAKAEALSESESESAREDNLERECDELKQQLAESQAALNGIQVSAADEKEALTVEKDDLLSQLAGLTVRTTGLSEALAAAQAIINEVRISAGPASHSTEVVEEVIGQAQIESREGSAHHSADAVVGTESEQSGEVQQGSGEWDIGLSYCIHV